MSEQKSARFNDVGKSQEIVLKILDQAIEENRILTEKERDKFIKHMRVATLGLGTEHRFIIKGKNQSYDLNHVGHVSYWLSYQKTNKIQMGSEDTIEIKEFWKILRDHFWQIFPYADFTSIKISKEQTHMGISKAGEV